MAGRTVVFSVMTKQGYIFNQLAGGKPSKATRFFCAFMTISYLLTTWLTARQISRKRTL